MVPKEPYLDKRRNNFMENKVLKFNFDKVIDLVGIGNAIVDIVVNVEDEFLDINKLKKGSMNLIDIKESKNILKHCDILKKVSGGSAANTVVALANLGNKVEFIGRVKDDKFGRYFSNDIKASGTIFEMKSVQSLEESAHSIILITPDAQRTMCTYLGASVEFEQQNINHKSIQISKFLYLEGYLWDAEKAKLAFLKAAKIAKESNTQIILSLSDSFCVERHRESFLKLIKNHVDILFCNESELKSLFKKADLNSCINDIKTISKLSIVTTGKKGSLIINENTIQDVKPYIFGEIIDTTGAGDIYAGGFIHGLINGFSLKDCGIFGSICAGYIITEIGSRPQVNLEKLIKENI